MQSQPSAAFCPCRDFWLIREPLRDEGHQFLCLGGHYVGGQGKPQFSILYSIYDIFSIYIVVSVLFSIIPYTLHSPFILSLRAMSGLQQKNISVPLARTTRCNCKRGQRRVQSNLAYLRESDDLFLAHAQTCPSRSAGGSIVPMFMLCFSVVWRPWPQSDGPEVGSAGCLGSEFTQPGYHAILPQVLP